MRQITARLRESLKNFPAVVIIGPRQCGKTTLAKSLSGHYFDMEQEKDRLRLELDWDSVINSDDLVIFDEAQCAEGLFPRLRGAIDENRKRNGRFLLLGSVSPALMHNVSDSLAGRLAIIELEPFNLNECDQSQKIHWLYGGYPDGGVLQPNLFPKWQKDYLQLLAQRDLPEWGLPSKPLITQRFMRMLAATHGNQWNASQLGKSLGLSYHTINEYLDFFEGAFLVRRLQPFSTNTVKRLVKRPKVYWRDSGLLHALMNVTDEDMLLSQPFVGNSWEGYIIQNILSHFNATSTFIEPYYLRTSDGYEIDLLFDLGNERWGVEIKLSASRKVEDLKRLQKIGRMVDCTHFALITSAGEAVNGENIYAGTLPGLLTRF